VKSGPKFDTKKSPFRSVTLAAETLPGLTRGDTGNQLWLLLITYLLNSKFLADTVIYCGKNYWVSYIFNIFNKFPVLKLNNLWLQCTVCCWFKGCEWLRFIIRYFIPVGHMKKYNMSSVCVRKSSMCFWFFLA